jgi:hypothetical protein
LIPLMRAAASLPSHSMAELKVIFLQCGSHILTKLSNQIV